MIECPLWTIFSASCHCRPWLLLLRAISSKTVWLVASYIVARVQPIRIAETNYSIKEVMGFSLTQSWFSMVQPSNWIFCLPTFTLKILVLSVLKLDTADFVLRHLRNCWNFHAPQMILLRPGRKNAASADHWFMYRDGGASHIMVEFHLKLTLLNHANNEFQS